MIRILYRHRSGTLIQDLPQDQLTGAIKDPGENFGGALEQTIAQVITRRTLPDQFFALLVFCPSALQSKFPPDKGNGTRH